MGNTITFIVASKSSLVITEAWEADGKFSFRLWNIPSWKETDEKMSVETMIEVLVLNYEEIKRERFKTQHRRECEYSKKLLKRKNTICRIMGS